MKRLAVMFAVMFVSVALLILTSSGLANATLFTLSNFNGNFNPGDDYVTVETGTVNSDTTLTVLWHYDDLGPSAIGLDKFFYNTDTNLRDCDPSTVIGCVKEVYRGSIALANNITSDWDTNFAGSQADGFGNFSSRKNLDSGGTDGISLANQLIFVLNDTPAFYAANSTDFAVHVRYENGCSGWFSGRPANGSSSEPGSCAAVPEPGTLLLLGSGLIGVAAFGQRLRKRG